MAKPGVLGVKAGIDTPTAPPSGELNLIIKNTVVAPKALAADATVYVQDEDGNLAAIGINDAFVRSGSVVLVAGTKSVVFGTAIAGAAYRIALSPNSDEVVHWANKLSTGFDIVSSDGGSVATVDYIITRQGAP